MANNEVAEVAKEVTREVNEQVRETVAETLGMAPEDLNDDASVETVAEWTSLQHLAVIAAVEERFGIEMDMDEMTVATNLRALSDVVARRGGA